MRHLRLSLALGLAIVFLRTSPARADLVITNAPGSIDAAYYYPTGTGNHPTVTGQLPLSLPSTLISDNLGQTMAVLEASSSALSIPGGANMGTDFAITDTGLATNGGYLNLISSATMYFDPKSVEPVQYLAYSDFKVNGHVAVGDTVQITADTMYAVNTGGVPNPYSVLHTGVMTYKPGDLVAEYAVVPSPIVPGTIFSFSFNVSVTIKRSSAEVAGDETRISFDPGVGVINPRAVPEPASLVMLVTGAFGMLCYARRKPKTPPPAS